ncbi:MAG: hypothetical protein M3N29_09375 [Chloroflexota bacterium]|nr:hypothetical protein [Chloroflexota bacterium]
MRSVPRARDFDWTKVAQVTTDGWMALDEELRERVLQVVDRDGGFRHEIDINDDGATVTIKMAGIPVATVETWRVLNTPKQPEARA